MQHSHKKKIWHQTVSLLRGECPGYGLGTLCGLFGYSRQSYYKWDNQEFAANAIEPLIVEKVSEYRKANPGLGCAKLYLIVKRLFDENDNMPGRDAFIELLRKKRLDGKAEATQTL